MNNEIPPTTAEILAANAVEVHKRVSEIITQALDGGKVTPSAAMIVLETIKLDVYCTIREQSKVVPIIHEPPKGVLKLFRR